VLVPPKGDGAAPKAGADVDAAPKLKTISQGFDQCDDDFFYQGL
jgi:hypothetical protein